MAKRLIVNRVTNMSYHASNSLAACTKVEAGETDTPTSLVEIRRDEPSRWLQCTSMGKAAEFFKGRAISTCLPAKQTCWSKLLGVHLSTSVCYTNYYAALLIA
jgi:hypothetical protein